MQVTLHLVFKLLWKWVDLYRETLQEIQNKKRETESKERLGWKRPLRSLSPTANPSPPCPLCHVPISPKPRLPKRAIVFRYLSENLSSPFQVRFGFSTFSYSFSSSGWLWDGAPGAGPARGVPGPCKYPHPFVLVVVMPNFCWALPWFVRSFLMTHIFYNRNS